jgi:hypothetical protein
MDWQMTKAQCQHTRVWFEGGFGFFLWVNIKKYIFLTFKDVIYILKKLYFYKKTTDKHFKLPNTILPKGSATLYVL